jgi:hypothetical protein
MLKSTVLVRIALAGGRSRLELMGEEDEESVWVRY